MAHPTERSDFRLRWAFDLDAPQAAFLHDGEHAMLLVEPPRALPVERPPRELVWVLDASCSMMGLPWKRVQETMQTALRDMDPADRFQVVRFDNTALSTFENPVHATPENVGRALREIEGMQPSGGTRMWRGIQQAMADPPEDVQRVAVFLSDGKIGTERGTLQVLETSRGSTRVHALAVGDRPNRYMMSQLAHLGGGRFMAPAIDDSPRATAKTFMEVLERPVVADLDVDWGANGARDVHPARMPLLYMGQPLMVVARLDGTPDDVVFRGRLGDGTWEQRLEPVLLDRGRALASTWARQHVQALQDRQVRQPDFDPKPEGLGVALEYSILSPWTAFIAVDPDSDVLASHEAALDEGRAVSESSSMIDGFHASDPVTGTFSANFNVRAIPSEPVSRDTSYTRKPVSVALDGELDLSLDLKGDLGERSSRGGRVDGHLSGPVVKNHGSVEFDLLAEDRAGQPTEDGPRRVWRAEGIAGLRVQPGTGVDVLARGGRRVRGQQGVGLAEWSGAEDLVEAGLWWRWFRTDVRASRWRLQHKEGSERVGAVSGRLDGTYRRLKFGDFRAQLGFSSVLEGVERSVDGGPVQSARAPVDRNALASGLGSEVRGTAGVKADVVFDQWRIIVHGEGIGGDRSGGYATWGGRASVLHGVDAYTFELGVRRAALPVGPGLLGSARAPMLHRAYAAVRLERDRAWKGVIEGSAEQILGVDDRPLTRASATVGLRYRRDGISGGLSYVRTHADERFERSMGVEGLAFAAPDNVLRAHWGLDWYPLSVRAEFVSDLSVVHDLGLRAAYEFAVHDGDLVVGVSGKNLLGSSDGRVGEAIDERWAWTGLPRPRRVEVDLRYEF